MSTSIMHWVGGERFSGTTERTGDVFDPATGSVTGRVGFGDVNTVDRAVSVASEAARAWRKTSLARRTAVLFAFRQILDERKDQLAEIITAENGKVLSDALGEVARGLEITEYACGIATLLQGSFSEEVSTGIDVTSIRQPVGVVAVISPFNFPAMVPMWFFPIAIAAGNTVILKPSEKVPSAAIWMAERLKEAGLPDGVFNVVHGDRETVGAILDHPGIAAVSFVGSTPVARVVYERATRAGKRVQALGGAKNHMLVLADANLEQAADAAVNAGFGSAGERCMAISALVVIDSVADQLIKEIVDRIKQLRTGDGRRSCDMGPLVTEQHRDRVAQYLQIAEAEGARMVVDGRDVGDVDGDAKGFWLKPSLLDHVTPAMRVYQDEIFGPVLSVLRVASFDDGVELINRSPYGNGTAIFTSHGGAARRFQTDIQVGMIGINVPIPVPMAYYSFGGWKSSLFGDSHAYGPDGVRFYTRGKVVTSRWPDPVGGGLDLHFPRSV